VYGTRFGSIESERTVAREVWTQPQFRFFRWFAEEPMLARVETGNPSTCVWFQDLRFFTPGRASWPFRYGMCREEGGEWRTHRLRDDNVRVPVT
jgi:inner membrane protein